MWEAILAAFAVGTFWFWFLVALDFIIITAFVENEEGVGATFSLIVGLIVLNFLSKLPVITFLVASPKRTALLVGSYFLAGFLWACVKWYFYLRGQLEAYNTAKAKLLKRRNVTELTPQLANDLRSEIISSYGRDRVEVNPQILEHKAEFTRWMTYWPFSGLWTIINDPVRRIFRAIFNHTYKTLQALSDQMFRGANADLKLAEQAKNGKEK